MESGQKDLSSRPTWATWKDPVSKLFWSLRSAYMCVKVGDRPASDCCAKVAQENAAMLSPTASCFPGESEIQPDAYTVVSKSGFLI